MRPAGSSAPRATTGASVRCAVWPGAPTRLDLGDDAEAEAVVDGVAEVVVVLDDAGRPVDANVAVEELAERRVGLDDVPVAVDDPGVASSARLACRAGATVTVIGPPGRTTWPGSAPVGSPSTMTGTPLTMVALTPTGHALNRPAPPGSRGRTPCGRRRSCRDRRRRCRPTCPARASPGRRSPSSAAGNAVSRRMPSSSHHTSRSRIQLRRNHELQSAPSSRARCAPPSDMPDDHAVVELGLGDGRAPLVGLPPPPELGLEVLGEREIEHRVGRRDAELLRRWSAIVRPSSVLRARGARRGRR